MQITVRSYKENSSGVLFLDSKKYINVSWSDILTSTVFVGRRSQDILRFGRHSYLDLLHRVAIVSANIMSEGSFSSSRLVPTDAFKYLDPSEKGAVTYFLGMTFTHLLSSRELDMPVLMHLDVYTRPNPYGYMLPADVRAPGSRPDFIGQKISGEWGVFEAKGRTNFSNSELRRKMKDQVKSIPKIAGVPTSEKYGACVSLGNDELTIDWVDPDNSDENDIDIDIDPDQFIVGSFDKIWNLFQYRTFKTTDIGVEVYIEEADFSIRMDRYLYNFLGEIYKFSEHFGYYADLEAVDAMRDDIEKNFRLFFKLKYGAGMGFDAVAGSYWSDTD